MKKIILLLLITVLMSCNQTPSSVGNKAQQTKAQQSTASKVVKDSKTKNNTSEENNPAKVILGTWAGKMNEKQLTIVIEKIDGENLVGYNILGTNKRNLKGTFSAGGIDIPCSKAYDAILNEPGDHEWDGVYNIKFIGYEDVEELEDGPECRGNLKGIEAMGEWKSNNGKKKHQVFLSREFVKVNYANKSQEYDFDINWRPTHKVRGYTFGLATINMTKDGSSRKIFNEHFGLESNKVKAEYNQDGKVTKIITKNLDIKDSDFNLSDGKLGYPQTPIFFFDLNFDGKKELILSQPAQGQRGRTKFLAFNAKGSKLIGKPYDALDSETKIDANTKEIIIHTSGGACGSIIDVYSSKNSNLQLAKKTKYDMKDGKCFEFTYEVINGVEKLLSKKEMTR